jgi:hypothetical protein
VLAFPLQNGRIHCISLHGLYSTVLIAYPHTPPKNIVYNGLYYPFLLLETAKASITIAI